jgi:dTDP-4-amino-4,6-dideoxygalactose transaminase
VQRGGVPVFVDIRPDTLNLDESLIEDAITSRTKAIIAVHYAGICAEMDAITTIAKRYGLIVIEDAAHAMLSTYRGRMAGSLGDFGCFSFHETKNVIAGEGGAIVFQSPALADVAAVVADKGTNREAFEKGRVASYTWTDCGSSFNMNELTAAFLYAQLEAADRFNAERRVHWLHYHDRLADLEAAGLVRRPVVPAHCAHNSHLYRLILRDQRVRDRIIQSLASEGISAPFHFIPLHSSPAGQRFGRGHGGLDITDQTSASLIRLPLHAGISSANIDTVIERLRAHLQGAS